MQLHKTVDLDPKRNYIFGVHPHGVLCIGAFTNFCSNGTRFDYIFPGFKSFLTMLPLWFYIPVYRDYLMGGRKCASLLLHKSACIFEYNFTLLVIKQFRHFCLVHLPHLISNDGCRKFMHIAFFINLCIDKQLSKCNWIWFILIRQRTKRNLKCLMFF